MTKKKPAFSFKSDKLSPMSGMAAPDAGFGKSNLRNKLTVGGRGNTTKGILSGFKNRASSYK